MNRTLRRREAGAQRKSRRYRNSGEAERQAIF